MARRLILDTGILIAHERGGLLAGIEPDDDVAIAAVTLGELLTGVELADDEARRTQRRAFVENLRQILPVLTYGEETAARHGALLAHVHRAGTPRGAHDLIIAATAIETNRVILTTDRAARFHDLPGLRVIPI